MNPKWLVLNFLKFVPGLPLLILATVFGTLLWWVCWLFADTLDLDDLVELMSKIWGTK